MTTHTTKGPALSLRGAARIVGVHATTLATRCAQGEGPPGVRLPNSGGRATWRFRTRDVEAWLDDHHVGQRQR